MRKRKLVLRITPDDIVTAAGLVKHALRGAPYLVMIEAVQHVNDSGRAEPVIAALGIMGAELATECVKGAEFIDKAGHPITADELMDGVIKRALRGEIRG